MCFLFHKWAQWKPIQKGPLLDRGVTVGFYVIQQKHCVKCRKIKYRTEKSYD